MKRKIIRIDDELCNGCGECMTSCSEGALQMVDGKARLVKEDFCDGFGDCIGRCPTGALTVEEREASDFNGSEVKKYLLETQGVEAVWRMEEAQNQHHHTKKMPHACPGAQQLTFQEPARDQTMSMNNPPSVLPSELRQWPVQIHLVNPSAAYFKNRELVVMSTCGPLASADVHWRFLRGRSVVVGCPKLDDTSPYVSKIAAILREPTIPRVIVPRMEVPCCGGLTRIVQDAVKLAERKDIIIEEHIIGVDGMIKKSHV